MSGRYSHKPLDYAKQSARDALKISSKRVIYSKIVKKSDFIGNKTPKRLLPQDNLETITNEHDEKIPKERYISPEEGPKIIDNVTVIFLLLLYFLYIIHQTNHLKAKKWVEVNDESRESIAKIIKLVSKWTA